MENEFRRNIENTTDQKLLLFLEIVGEIRQNIGFRNLNSEERSFLTQLWKRVNQSGNLEAENLTDEDWCRFRAIAERKPAKSSLRREQKLEELQRLGKIFVEEIGIENLNYSQRCFLRDTIREADRLEDVAIEDLHTLRDFKDRCLERGKLKTKIR